MSDTVEEEPNPYWNAWDLIANALAANSPAAAAAAFHRAVSLMPAAIAAAEADYDSVPEHIRSMRSTWAEDGEDPRTISYPLTEQAAFAFAAARGNLGSLKILDSMCGRGNGDEPEPCSEDYLRIVRTIQEMVAANEVTDIKDVRKVFSPTDRMRLRSVWREMRDAKMLNVESLGQKIFFHREAPQPAPAPVKPAVFRKGELAAEPLPIALPQYMKPEPTDLGSDAGRPSRDDPIPDSDLWPLAAPAASTPVPKDVRRTRKSDILSVGNRTWLQTGISKRADGSRYVPTTILNEDGSQGRSLELDYEGRFTSNPHGDCIVSDDRDGNVRIYTPDAEEVFAANLALAPEVRATMTGFGDRELRVSSAVRSLHASLEAQRFVVSVIDAVFVYSFSGEVIAAFKLEPIVQEHLFDGRVVSSMTKEDWAYFVKLSSDGRSFYIGAYSGALLHLDFNGELLNTWSLPGPPRILHETPEGVVGLTYNTFFQARRGEQPILETHHLDASAYALGDYVLMNGRSFTGFFDLNRFEGRVVELPKPRTAAYLANGVLTMETAMVRYSF